MRSRKRKISTFHSSEIDDLLNRSETWWLSLRNASQQQTIDRYDNGDDVPYEELRKVWADTSYVGWFPTITALDYRKELASYSERIAVYKNLVMAESRAESEERDERDPEGVGRCGQPRSGSVGNARENSAE
jgi:hypothetical protein